MKGLYLHPHLLHLDWIKVVLQILLVILLVLPTLNLVLTWHRPSKRSKMRQKSLRFHCKSLM